MKCLYLLPVFLFFAVPHAFAQDTADGCDGIRYIQEPFSEVEMHTLAFGENINASGQNQVLFMDIYEPVGDTVSQRPVIIWAFGGGFVGGDRSDMEETCREFARRGFVAAAFDYRLYDLAQGIPDSLGTLDMITKAMHDMKAAIRFFRMDADNDNMFRIDPDRILVGGVSAGAITALHAAYLDEDDDIPLYLQDIIEDNGGLEGSSGDAMNLSYDSDIQFVVSLSGALYKRDWIDASEAPLLSIHGTEDEIVPYGHGFLSIEFGIVFTFNSVDGSGVLHPVMDDLGMDNLHIAVPGGMHEDIYLDPAYESYRAEFTISGALMMYDHLCPDVPIVITDVYEVLTDSEVQIFPNPARENIQIDILPERGQYSLHIFDPTGRCVHIESGLQGPEQIALPANLAPGSYILHLESDQWHANRKLIIR